MTRRAGAPRRRSGRRRAGFGVQRTPAILTSEPAGAILGRTRESQKSTVARREPTGTPGWQTACLQGRRRRAAQRCRERCIRRVTSGMRDVCEGRICRGNYLPAELVLQHPRGARRPSEGEPRARGCATGQTRLLRSRSRVFRKLVAVALAVAELPHPPWTRRAEDCLRRSALVGLGP